MIRRHEENHAIALMCRVLKASRSGYYDWYHRPPSARAQANQRLLRDNGLVCSMSKKGNCYDNAAMESWNHSLKVEAIHGERFVTRQAAKDQVFEYIEVYYTRKRLHSRLGYLSPEAFELQHVA